MLRKRSGYINHTYMLLKRCTDDVVHQVQPNTPRSRHSPYPHPRLLLSSSVYSNSTRTRFRPPTLSFPKTHEGGDEEPEPPPPSTPPPPPLPPRDRSRCNKRRSLLLPLVLPWRRGTGSSLSPSNPRLPRSGIASANPSPRTPSTPLSTAYPFTLSDSMIRAPRVALIGSRVWFLPLPHVVFDLFLAVQYARSASWNA